MSGRSTFEAKTPNHPAPAVMARPAAPSGPSCGSHPAVTSGPSRGTHHTAAAHATAAATPEATEVAVTTRCHSAARLSWVTVSGGASGVPATSTASTRLNAHSHPRQSLQPNSADKGTTHRARFLTSAHWLTDGSALIGASRSSIVRAASAPTAPAAAHSDPSAAYVTGGCHRLSARSCKQLSPAGDSRHMPPQPPKGSHARIAGRNARIAGRNARWARPGGFPCPAAAGSAAPSAGGAIKAAATAATYRHSPSGTHRTA